jgi:hypothetical protein
MPNVQNRRFWTAGYLSMITFFGFNLMGLSTWEPVRKWNRANIKKL